MNNIPVYKPRITNKEKEYVNQCLDTSWISSRGDFLQKFQDQFSKFTGIKYSTGVCNGTVAIHLALEALGIGPGDEVIVPTLTYVATANPVKYVGATPIFVDSLERNWQIDPEMIRRKLTHKTKAIIVVHLYGHPCDMTEIKNICDEYNLFLIEDCAEAFGSYYKNRHVGGFGDVSTFSFFGNKTITTGEGGMVCTNSLALHNKLVHLKGQGVSPYREYWHDVIGFNYRMTNICAAIGLAQLESANNILSNKRRVAEFYKEKLSSIVEVHGEDSDCINSYWMVSILVNPEIRDKLRAHLKDSGIETRPVFHPMHTMPVYSKKYECHPVAELISSRGLNLPSYPDLTEKELNYICDKILEFV